MKCFNCKVEVPEGKGGQTSSGQFVCCEHCMFNPLGCRCKFGEFGVAETYVDVDEEFFDDPYFGIEDDE